MKNAFRYAMEWKYKHRWIAEKMRQAIEFSPVTVLSGTRLRRLFDAPLSKNYVFWLCQTDL